MAERPGFLTRAKNAVSLLMGKDSWFPAGQPLQGVAPPDAVAGRQFDFSPNVNAIVQPRGEDFGSRSIRFPQLRFLADSVEVLRLVIETRKDQICGMEWDFRVIGQKGQASRNDPRVQWCRKFFRRPDGAHDFQTWLRMIQEDLNVLDAVAIRCQRNDQGDILAFEQVDGATIKPLMTDMGRIPAAPYEAFLHVLHGISAISYSVDDLIYKPRNLRINSLYGYGPVEQIQVYANITIRRQMQQLGYFTDGNLPEGMVPVSGTAEQVEKFQRIWDAGEIEGQKIGRVRFVPADTASKFIPFKDAVLADAFDEWMARIICYTFAVEPTPFIKAVNRATAETARDQSSKEGVSVQLKWVKSLLDEMVQEYLGFEEIETFVAPIDETDPIDLGAHCQILVESGIMRVDEAREKLGLEGDAPLLPAPPQAPTEETPGAPVPVAAPKPPEAQQVAHVARLNRAVFNAKRSRALAVKRETAITDSVFSYFQKLANHAAEEIGKSIHRVQRADSEDGFDPDTINLQEDNFLKAVGPSIESIFGDSASIALDETGAAVKLGFKAESAEWAKERGAWLVGKHVTDEGEVVDAIRPEYRVTDICRQSIRDVTAQATEENWTTSKIAEVLKDDHAFSRARAQTIASTEIVNADEQGKLAGWKASGLKLQKRSILGSNENHGADDILNAAEGWIPLNDPYQDGNQAPPLHPNCRCTSVARSIP